MDSSSSPASQPVPDSPGRTGAGLPPGESSWGPARWISVVTAIVTVASIAWCLLDRDPENRLVAAVLAMCCAAATAALLRVRVRLRLVPDGIVVTGPLHSTRLPYQQIVGIATPTRGRFGRRTVTLELEVHAPGTDPADDQLVIFGRFDLNADPAAVGRELRRHRAAAGL